MSDDRLPPNTGPPKKERGVGTALNTAEVPVIYHFLLGIQADVRGRECARLFLEFWRTGDPKHLEAFVQYVTGLRACVVEGSCK
jgi:hypothetical protein